MCIDFIQTKAPIEECRKKIFLVDSKVSNGNVSRYLSRFNLFALFSAQGLIVSSRKDTLQHFKKPWAHEYEPIKGLLDSVKVRGAILLCPQGSFLSVNFLSVGYQTDSVDWFIWGGKDFHERSDRGHVLLQRGKLSRSSH